MCRVGGRRCPGEHDPAVKAARNARRRAKYAADKAAGKIVSKKKKKTKVEPIVSTSEISDSQMTLGEKNQTDEQLQLEQPPIDSPEYEVFMRRRALGLETKKNTQYKNISGEKDPMDREYILSGKIDHTKLDDQSYKDFGFAMDADNDNFGRWQISKGKVIDTYEMSKEETKELQPQELKSIRAFTGSAYMWINAYLFKPEQMSELKEDLTFEDIQAQGGGFTHDVIFPENGRMTDKSIMTASASKRLMRTLTNRIDTGLDRGPKKQRLVYRGIHINALTDNPDEWLRKERYIGAEVVFDGYTSTTSSAKSALHFAGDSNDAVVYEILTPEGMAVSSVSQFDFEQEILLPRNQRYMVVGVQQPKNSSGYSGDKVTVIQMVAINSKGEVLDGTNSDPIKPLETN